jgi:cell wall-associated NlpC family hydrolase
MAKVKGQGVDCLHFISETYREAGIVDVNDIPKYPWQWNLNKGEETYLNGLLRYAREVETPQPGDIAIWKIARTFSHAAIVIDWPLVIHSVTGIGVVEENVTQAIWLHRKGAALRPVKYFSYW